MLIVVSDDTQDSWWVPWEIGVSTPLGTLKAMYKPQAKKQLPTYLKKIPRLRDYQRLTLGCSQIVGATSPKYPKSQQLAPSSIQSDPLNTENITSRLGT